MKTISRRNFLAAASAAYAIGVAPRRATAGTPTEAPALLGGKPVRTEPFPSPAWPIHGSEEKQSVVDAVRSGTWFRGYSGPSTVARFEAAFAEMTKAKYCLATTSCTAAMEISLAALGVGPGDEVILPPYTFPATLNVILMRHALPVFVDIDPETAQIDAGKIEAAITSRTVAIMPVHIGGAPADLDAILTIARKHKVAVVEDAAQSVVTGWHGQNVGTFGDTGCFSFQASKNLNCGEGGAILTANEELYEKCYAFHWNGQGRKTERFDFTDSLYGTKFCMTAFQAAILLAQMGRLEQQSKTREQNAEYLSSLLKEIPGVTPTRLYPGTTRHSYHIYTMCYNSEHFSGLPRDKFLKAVQAEGIPLTAGYSPLNKRQFFKNTLRSRAYQRIYTQAELSALEERNQCPVNEHFCREIVLGLYQTALLTGRSEMEQVATAMRKVQVHAAQLANS